MNLSYYRTGIGKIGIAECQGRISNLYFETDPLPQGAELSETAVLREASQQLAAYLDGELRVFSLPLAPEGTVFRQKIWKLLCEIPYGMTASYRDIAIAAGNPGAARAVGLANNRNPLPIFIPCHRVIGRDGRLVGYRGGLALKTRLLELERVNAGI